MKKWQKLTKKCNDLALTLIVNISGYKQYFLDLSKVEVRVFVAGAVEKGQTNWSQAMAV